ncbi:MAG: DUF4435 domain-containing protein [bacterium]
MSEALVKRMREARDGGATVLVEYAALRTRVGKSLIIIVEGRDDLPVYDVWLRRLQPTLDFRLLPASSKRSVLLVLASIEKNVTFKEDLVWYFVDRDFDDDHAEHNNLYVHETYSVENILTTESVIERVFRTELLCVGASGEDDVARCMEVFSARWDEYLHEIRDLNHLIFACRRAGVPCSPPDRTHQVVSVSLGRVTRLTSLSDERRLCGVEADADQLMSASAPAFAELCPRSRYRGKLHLCAFLRLLLLICADRRSEAPKLFNETTNISYNPYANSLGFLAGKCEVPVSLGNWVAARVVGTASPPAPLAAS